MTAVQTAPGRSTRVENRYRLSFVGALRGEWIKLATLRSTWWAIGLTGAMTLGIALLISGALDAPGTSGIMAVVMPIQFTMLLAGILGAIAVTGEYSTGMIRSTLTAVPVRGRVLAAKAVVVAAFLFLASMVILLVTALAVSPILGGKDMAIAWGDVEKTWVPMLAASLAMAVFALIGLSFGFMLRSGAGAIAATIGLLFVLPIVTNMFGFAGEAWKWIIDASQYLPMSAAQAAITPPAEGGLQGATPYLALAAWVVAGMLGAWAVLRARDV